MSESATEVTILVEELLRAKEKLRAARAEYDVAERLYNEAMVRVKADPRYAVRPG